MNNLNSKKSKLKKVKNKNKILNHEKTFLYILKNHEQTLLCTLKYYFHKTLQPIGIFIF